jgi:hypothetical protein
MKKYFFTILALLSILTFTVYPFAASPAYAQLSGCVQIPVGNPSQKQTVPADCGSGGGDGSVVWPYQTKAPTQFNRVDQGWDLEYTSMGNPVYAVVSGTINYDHGPNPCNGGTGFGDTYPLEVLDKPVTVNGRTYTEIYYGHVNGIQSLNGKKVTAGTVIAHTYQCVLSSGAFIPWLEIGFWGPGGPVGQAVTPCSIDTVGGSLASTQAGCDMKQWLNANTK